MKIKVNGKEKIIKPGSFSVADLLKEEKVENPQMLSVQLNSEFLNRENFASTQLKEADEVDFLYFMGGGGKDLKLITKILHTKFLKEDPHGALHMPVYDDVTF